MPRAAVVLNPARFAQPEQLRAELTEVFRSGGWAPPLWLPTTAEDPGGGQARSALKAGADLICPLGGDGTVRNVAQPLIGTDTPVGLVPSGTGNLLARNLGLSARQHPTESIRQAMRGTDRRIDVGMMGIDRDGTGHRVENYVFLVMCGMGLDADMLDGTPDSWKDRLGWPAYVLAGLRHLRAEPVQTQVQIDGRDRPERTLSTVLVGNCGRLTGGVRLMPQAVVDDGLLDATLLSAASLPQWGRLAAQVLTGRQNGKQVQHLTGADIQIRASSPRTIQVDGDILGQALAARVSIRPASLSIRLPRAA